MNILVFSWRDIKHPNVGGAEWLAHETMKRWVKMGHQVTHYSALFPNAKEEELIDDVRYIRNGTWYNVHIKALADYLWGRIGKYDVIVDEVHGIPFFSKLYARVPVVCHVCEVAKNVWDEMYPFPFNIVGKILERLYLLYYRNMPFIAISESTKYDLVENGIVEKNITVTPMGFNYSLPKKLPKKAKNPTVIFLGRLAKTKGIPDAITAFALIRARILNAKMYVVGKGKKEYVLELKKLAKKLKVSKDIEFKGFVTEKEKSCLLAKSYLILVPSVREGWGLIVPEANIVGTPAIVYNVPGLRDVTKNDINGIVVKNNTPNELSKAAIKLLSDKKKYETLRKSSIEYAKSMDWNDTAKVSIKVLKDAVENRM